MSKQIQADFADPTKHVSYLASQLAAEDCKN